MKKTPEEPKTEKTERTAQDELYEALVCDDMPDGQTLAQHDEQHHPNGYHEGDTCKFRDRIMEETDTDKADEVDTGNGEGARREDETPKPQAKVYDGLSRKKVEKYTSQMAKNHPELNADLILTELAKIKDPKIQGDAFAWVMKGAIKLPEDMYKVEQARELSTKAKRDPLSWDTPQACINDLLGEGHKKRADTITVDSLKKNPLLSKYRNEGHGVETFEVQDSPQGMQLIRDIINSHLGEDRNPWCLSKGDGNGKLLDEASFWWDEYGAIPKRVALKDGRIIAFSASTQPYRDYTVAEVLKKYPQLEDEYYRDVAEGRYSDEIYYWLSKNHSEKFKRDPDDEDPEGRPWYDVWDEQHKGIPIGSVEVPNDKLRRKAQCEIRSGEVVVPEGQDLFVGKRDKPGYKKWGCPLGKKDFQDYVLREEITADGTEIEYAYDGKRIRQKKKPGEWRVKYFPNGRVQEEFNGNDEMVVAFYENGTKSYQRFEDGGYVFYDEKGNIDLDKRQNHNAKECERPVYDELVSALIGETYVEDALPKNETLAEHDKKKHPDGFNPKTDTCKFREKIATETETDKADIENPYSDPHKVKSDIATSKEKNFLESVAAKVKGFIKGVKVKFAEKPFEDSSGKKGRVPISRDALEKALNRIFDEKIVDIRGKDGDRERIVKAALEFFDTYGDAEFPLSTGGVMFFAPAIESIKRLDGDKELAWAEYAIHAVTNDNVDKQQKHFRNYGKEKIEIVNPIIEDIVKADNTIIQRGRALYFLDIDDKHSARLVAKPEHGDLRVDNLMEVTATYLKKNKTPDTTMPLVRAVEAWTSRGDIPNSSTDNDSISNIGSVDKGGDIRKSKLSKFAILEEWLKDEEASSTIGDYGKEKQGKNKKSIVPEEGELLEDTKMKEFQRIAFENQKRSHPKEEEAHWRELDNEYRKYVESGDIAKALSLIKRVAKANGYDTRAYHGSPEDNIQIFNPYISTGCYARGTFLSESPSVAKTYARYGRVYPTFVSLGKSLVVDCGGRKWNDLSKCEYKDANFARKAIEKRLTSTDNIVDEALVEGYDSVVFENVIDIGNPDSVKGNARESIERPHRVFDIFDPSRIKSSEIEYDDKGNLIPLSDRFNPNNPDIRYFRADDGKVVGTYNRRTNEVTLYPGADADTIAHELCGHATWQYAEQQAKKGNSTLIKKMNEVVDSEIAKPVWDEVAASYDGEDHDVQREEVWAHIVGHRGSKAIEEIRKQKKGQKWYQKAWGVVKDAWRGLVSAAGLNKVNTKGIDKMSPEEFSDYMVKQMLAGKTLGNISKEGEGEEGTERKSIRSKPLVTPEEDAAYMDAVEKGDMETAAKMVREAAAKSFPETIVVDENGLPKVFYHGTKYDIKRFIVPSRGSVFFAPTEEGAKYGAIAGENERYGEQPRPEKSETGKFHVIPVYLDCRSIYNVSPDKAEREFYNRLPDFVQNEDEMEELRQYEKSLSKNEQAAYHDALAMAYQSGWNEGNGTYKKQPLPTVSQRRFYDVPDWSAWGGMYKGRDLGPDQQSKAFAIDNGHDSFMVRDEGGKSIALWDTTKVKSAAPVEYDDNGKVVPLSRRFDAGDDIRGDVSGKTEYIEKMKSLHPDINSDELIDRLKNLGSRAEMEAEIKKILSKK